MLCAFWGTKHRLFLYSLDGVSIWIEPYSHVAHTCAVVSWVWLRFYKRTVLEGSLGGVTTHGDRSETFAFVNWFPPFAQYVYQQFALAQTTNTVASKPVSKLSTFVYTHAVRFKLVHPSGSSGSDGNDLELGNGGYAPLPGGARAEAERRRYVFALTNWLLAKTSFVEQWR